MKNLFVLSNKLLGGILLALGLVAAYYGPLEIHVFSFFAPGGRFHYEGFGFGSLWFGALVIQNLGYYVIAAICLPLGIGHLKRRRWTLHLAKLFLWFWLGAGIILISNLAALVPAVLDLEMNRQVLIGRITLTGGFSLVTLVVAPVVGLWFYHRQEVISLFIGEDEGAYWTDRYPLTVQALLLLLLVAVLVLHMAIFFQGIFPMFGVIIHGRTSVYIITFCILAAGILGYGALHLEKWSWWGLLGYFSTLSISSGLTFPRYSFMDLIQLMNLPAFEIDFIDNLTLLHNLHLTGLILPPLLVAVGLVVISKRYFR